MRAAIPQRECGSFHYHEKDMIEYLRGELTEIEPTYAVIECNGIGYGLNISLNTFSAIQGKGSCKLYVYESIREDAYVLYGFVSKEERELFLLLISVSGIGGNTARMMLSALSAQELVNAISSEDANALKNVKGIGLKTAQRIIVELKDKMKNIGLLPDGSVATTKSSTAVNSKVAEEAIAALTMLGFAPTPSQKAVNSILKSDPEASVETVVKTALKML